MERVHQHGIARSSTLTPDLRLPHHPSVDRRRFLLTSLAGIVAAPLATETQQPSQTPASDARSDARSCE
jgi:7,8-dihydro-6-hydroxymethylpterin-pyrophosphokinase